MSALRTESRARARALQLLYAWDVQDGPPISEVADRLLILGRGAVDGAPQAERMAQWVVDNRERLDRTIATTIEDWRWSRVGLIERNILRLGLCELECETAPPKVVIDEAVRLARWFAGEKAPGFVNGVLDALARQLGRL